MRVPQLMDKVSLLCMIGICVNNWVIYLIVLWKLRISSKKSHAHLLPESKNFAYIYLIINEVYPIYANILFFLFNKMWNAILISIHYFVLSLLWYGLFMWWINTCLQPTYNTAKGWAEMEKNKFSHLSKMEFWNSWSRAGW